VKKKIEPLLKARGYRVRSKMEENSVYIAADKNRYFRLGTYLSHFSLILFVFAFIAGSHFGFRSPNFEVPVGNTVEVGHNTGLELQLISFVDQYYDNGMPKDYRSQVVLYQNGQVVKQATVRVNHPLTYHGIRFYQAFFGPTAELQVRQAGTVIFNGKVPLDNSSESGGLLRYIGQFDLGQNGLEVRLISSAVNGSDSMIPAGQVGLEVLQSNQQIGLTLMQPNDPQTIGNLEFTYLGASQFSGFQVTKDPTNTVIWIASIFFIIGISVVFYFPYRHIWVLVQAHNQSDSLLFIRSLTTRSFNTTPEIDTFVNQLKKELRIPEGKRKQE
jgi:cytochrome c biogenesis protein